MPSLTLHQTEVPRLLAWTQTAIVRPLKYQDIHVRGEYATYPDGAKEGMIFLERDSINGDRIVKLVTVQGVGLTKDVTPFRVGVPLWCRETWLDVINPDTQQHVEYRYRADGSDSEAVIDNGGEVIVAEFQWRSPVTMPREASRITVTPTAVRVCRVQDVTEEEAMALGVEPLFSSYPTARESFSSLWQSIHGKRHPWASNPWVAVANVDVEVKK